MTWFEEALTRCTQAAPVTASCTCEECGCGSIAELHWDLQHALATIAALKHALIKLAYPGGGEWCWCPRHPNDSCLALECTMARQAIGMLRKRPV